MRGEGWVRTAMPCTANGAVSTASGWPSCANGGWTARAMVAKVLADRTAWVRINAVRSRAAEADLEALAGLAAGIRAPKVESAEDVQWVVDRAPCTPLICAIETAPGLL